MNEAPDVTLTGRRGTPVVPDHRLDRVIGRGAYGEVWRAVNVMGAGRAVKVLWRDQFDSDRPYDREFAALQQYEAVSRGADGLVAVLHIGRNDAAGYFYYVMELADPLEPDRSVEAYQPRTLKALLEKGGPLDPILTAAVATRLAQGLAALHAHGLVHRDVKPANVIFAGGQAKLADVGLVTAIAGPEASTLGTSGYVPPEGQGAPPGDVFALGVVLYEALTGQKPEDFPQVPAAWLAKAPPLAGELLEVALRAAEPAVERRYATAGAVIADLALIASGQSAREMRGLSRRVRWLRWAVGLGTAAALTGGILVIGQRLTHETELSKIGQDTARREAESNRRSALLFEATTLRRSGRAGDRQKAVEQLLTLARTSPTPAERERLRSELAGAWSRPDAIYSGRSGQVESLAHDGNQRARISPEGQLTLASLAGSWQEKPAESAGRKVLSGGRFNQSGSHFATALEGGGMALWESSSGQIRAKWPDNHEILWAFAPDGLTFYHTAPPLGVVRAVDLRPEPSPDRVEWLMGFPAALVPCPDNRYLALGWTKEGGAQELRLWDRSSQRVVQSWPMPERHQATGPWAMAWNPDNSRIAVRMGQDRVQVLWREPGPAPLWLSGHRGLVLDIIWSDDGQFILTTDWSSTTRLWSASTGEELIVMDEPGLALTWMGPTPGFAVQQSPGGPIRYSVTTPLVASYATGTAPLGVAFSPDGRCLAVDGQDAMVIYDLTSRQQVARLPLSGALNPVWPDKADALFAIHPDGVVKWPVRPGPNDQLTVGPRETIAKPGGGHLTLSADGRMMAWGDTAGALRVLGPEPGSSRTLGPAGGSDQLLLDPSGRWVSRVPWHGNEGFCCYPVNGGEPWTVAPDVAGGVFYHAFLPDGSAVLTNDGQRGLQRWPAGASKPDKILPPDVARTGRAGVAVSGDGRWLAAQTQSGQIALLDAASWQVLIRLEVPSRDFASGGLTFSQDGAWLTANSWQGFVHVWDLRLLRQRLADVGLDLEAPPYPPSATPLRRVVVEEKTAP